MREVSKGDGVCRLQGRIVLFKIHCRMTPSPQSFQVPLFVKQLLRVTGGRQSVGADRQREPAGQGGLWPAGGADRGLLPCSEAHVSWDPGL